MNKLILAATLLLVGGTLAPASAQSKAIKDMIAVEDTLDEMCRGWDFDGTKQDQVCTARDKLYSTIKSMGWCYADMRKPSNEWAWHPCAQR